MTKTITNAEETLGQGTSKRVLQNYRKKIDALFSDIEALNNEYLALIDDDVEFEEASTWITNVEAKLFLITAAIDDELEQRIDEASSISSFVSAHKIAERMSASIGPEAIPEYRTEVALEPTSPTGVCPPGSSSAMPEPPSPCPVVIPPQEKGPNTAIFKELTPVAHEVKQAKAHQAKQENLSFDSWIDKLDPHAQEMPIDELNSFADTLISLHLKLESYGGEPLKYQDFITSFRHQVHERRSLDDSTKFIHLLSHLNGPPRIAVEGLPRNSFGYKSALQTLKDTFGDPVTISRAYIERAIKGDPISQKDPIGLRNYYYELCSTNMGCIKKMAKGSL
ncbi:MAG: DUF1759 domain-containing protein [Pseudomonadota bacterium]